MKVLVITVWLLISLYAVVALLLLPSQCATNSHLALLSSASKKVKVTVNQPKIDSIQPPVCSASPAITNRTINPSSTALLFSPETAAALARVMQLLSESGYINLDWHNLDLRDRFLMEELLSKIPQSLLFLAREVGQRNTPASAGRELVQIITSIGGEKAEEYLLRIAIHSPDIEVRKEAICSLSPSLTRNRDELRKILQSKATSSSLKKAAIATLSCADLPETAALLFSLAKDEKDIEVKNAAFEAFARVAHKSPLSYCIEAVKMAADLPEVREDLYRAIAQIAGSRRSKILAPFLQPEREEWLQRLLISHIEPNCEVAKDALLWALLYSSIPFDAAKRFDRKTISTMRENLFKMLLNDIDGLSQREENAKAVIFLISQTNSSAVKDERVCEMLLSLVDSFFLPLNLRAYALEFISPPYVYEVKEKLIAIISTSSGDALGETALAKIKQSPFAEVMPVLARIIISSPYEVTVSERLVDGDLCVICQPRYPQAYILRMLEVVGKAGLPEAINALAEIANSQTADNIRISALDYLNNFDNNLAVSIAKDIFLSNDCGNKPDFAWLLERFMSASECEEFFTQIALYDSDCDRRLLAICLLGRIDSSETALYTLIKLAREDDDWRIRRDAVNMLPQKDSAFVQSLLLKIAETDCDSDVTKAAINLLDPSSPEVIPALMRFAEQGSYAAIEKLASTGSPEAAKFLFSMIEKYKDDEDSPGRGWGGIYNRRAVSAASALVSMGGEYRIAAFREMLFSPKMPWRRAGWAREAANYDEPEIESLLRTVVLTDPSETVRNAASQALQKIYQRYETRLVREGLANKPEPAPEPEN